MNFIKKTWNLIWGNLHSRIWFIVTVIMLVLVLVISIVLTQNRFLSETFDRVFGSGERYLVSGTPAEYFTADYESKKDVLAAANTLNEQIAEEGFVLLKNKDNKSLPLSEGAKISVFGKNSVNIIYGGSGSGSSDNTTAKTLYESLHAAGFETNDNLEAFYNNNSQSGEPRKVITDIPDGDDVDLGTAETPRTSYGNVAGLRASYAGHSDAALVVFSRTGGEGYDLPRGLAGSNQNHYLKLDSNERDLLSEIKEAGVFKKIIIILNSSTQMELDFLEDDAEIDAGIWIGGPGATGMMALGRILKGEVNPSGRLISTYSRNFLKDPTLYNFATNTGIELSTRPEIAANKIKDSGNRYLNNQNWRQVAAYYFVDYEESIYMGYRYYETRGFTDGDEWYKDNVVYSFGHGLSYTGFDWEIENADELANLTLNDETKNKEIEIKVKVTNTGDRAGKDVVQLYVTPQYYEGEIEKPHVMLAGIAKTELIEPDDNTTVTISVNPYEFASYDYNDANGNGFKGYELDAGNYLLKLQNNAHDLKEGVSPIGLIVNATASAGRASVKFDKDPVTGTEVINRYDDLNEEINASERSFDRLLSRSDWASTWPTQPTADQREVDSDFIASFKWVQDDNPQKPYYSDTTPTTDASVTLKLWDLIGEDYDSQRWSDFMDQLTFNEMADLIGHGSYSTTRIDRVGKMLTTDSDGPTGWNKGFMNTSSTPAIYDTCSYVSQPVLASTWNLDLANKMGIMIGNEGVIGNERGDGQAYSGWYAPGVNMHRNPFGGRNFEYYSEDPFIAGYMAANLIKGANTKGVYTQLKHFAVNDQETNRRSNGLVTWLTEQSLREIYLKPFEIAVKVGESRGIMSAFNRIGKVWTGGDYRLLTEILRNEWGFSGMVITDYTTPQMISTYTPVDQMIRAGGDLHLTNSGPPTTAAAALTPTQATLIRQSAHRVLYVIANSNAMNGFGDSAVWGYRMSGWKVVMIWIDIAIVVALAGWGTVAIISVRKKNKIKQ